MVDVYQKERRSICTYFLSVLWELSICTAQFTAEVQRLKWNKGMVIISGCKKKSFRCAFFYVTDPSKPDKLQHVPSAIQVGFFMLWINISVFLQVVKIILWEVSLCAIIHNILKVVYSVSIFFSFFSLFVLSFNANLTSISVPVQTDSIVHAC